MGLIVVGLNHRTAPVELREQLALSEDELRQVLPELGALEPLSAVFLTATCNRFEVYARANDLGSAEREVISWLKTRSRDGEALEDGLYIHRDDAAIHHLFRVTASLDSMIIGEPQVQGQVKKAFTTASEAGTVDNILVRCMSRALKVAKRVRNETGIAKQPVSIPSVSVQLAKKVFGNLAGRSVLLVGAGEMCELAAKHFQQHRVSEIHVANRTLANAEAMAHRINGQAYSLDAVPDLLADVDVVMSSTAASEYVIQASTVADAFCERRYRPLLCIDIAVPRDIDPKVGELSNVYLFDVDDLQQVVTANRSNRQKEARSAEQLVAQEVERFHRALDVDQIAPTIVKLRESLTSIKEEELSRAAKGLAHLAEADMKRVEKFATVLVNRILHDPTVALRKLAEKGGTEDAVEWAEKLFNFSDQKDGSDPKDS